MKTFIIFIAHNFEYIDQGPYVSWFKYAGPVFCHRKVTCHEVCI